MEKMRATVFHGINDIHLEEVERPHAGIGETVIRIALTTICGTDLHIVRGEYPVKPGLIIGHEPVGVIKELGPGVIGYEIGDRVLVGAITPCGQCRACLSGQLSQCGHGQGYEAIGGWRFGNTINGAQADYLLVPYAQGNLAKIPDEVTDEQVVLLADIASTGFSGAESGGVKIGDSVAVFAQGPIGLCATAGAKLMGAALVIGIDGDETRLAMARRMGADVVLDYREVDVVSEIKRLTGGGTDVAIEALGTQQTFENALRCLRPGGTLSSLGVYSGKLQMPYEAFAAGLGDHRIVTTLCPGGKERMRRLIEVVRRGRVDELVVRRGEGEKGRRGEGEKGRSLCTFTSARMPQQVTRSEYHSCGRSPEECVDYEHALKEHVEMCASVSHDGRTNERLLWVIEGSALLQTAIAMPALLEPIFQGRFI